MQAVPSTWHKGRHPGTLHGIQGEHGEPPSPPVIFQSHWFYFSVALSQAELGKIQQSNNNRKTTTKKVANSAKIKNKMQTGILLCFCQVGSFPISVSEHRKPLCEQLPSIPYLSSRAAALRLALVAEIAATGIEGRSEGRNSTETGTLQ